MDEVSWKVFQFYAETMAARGIPGELLVEGLPRGAALLARQRRWYDWEEHIVICERFARLCGGPEAAESNVAAANKASWVKPLHTLARQFTSPRHIYWVSTRLFAPYLYRHLSFACTEIDRDTVRLVIDLPASYTPCETVFRMWRGAYRTAPRMLGLPDAVVDADLEAHRATYTIHLPASQSLPRRAVARAQALLNHRQLVEELSGHLAQLRETYEALARAYNESERMQRALLVAMPDIILRVTRDGVVTDVEGARSHSLRGPLVSLRSLADPAGAGLRWAARAFEDVQRALAGSADLVFAFNEGEGRARRDYECRTVAVNGETALCVIRDITTQRQLEQQLRVAERMASLGTLAAGIAHEINNPLTYVFANLERLETDLATAGPAAAPTLGAVREALHGAERVRDIVRGVKRFTRPETMQLEPTDVNVVVDNVLRVVAPQLRHRAHVVLELGPDVFAQTNAGQLEQVLVNLLVNAAEALPEAPVRVDNTVSVRTARGPDGSVVIDVKDTGPGIPLHVQEHIFDPFFTTKAVGVGTGLGLSICHRILSQLQGSIAVLSAPGEGALFRVELPGAARPAPPPHAVLRHERAPAQARVLLVDDEVLITKTLKMLLEDYAVTTANGGLEAIRLLSTQDFDVVLCDVMMPDVTGIDVYRHVREARPDLAKRFIFMTGDSLTSLASGLPTDEGAWLEKPFAGDTVLAALARVLAPEVS